MFDVHENLPVCHDLGEKHRTSDVLHGEKVTFSSLLLKEEIQKGLTRCGYVYLSPIQKNALPLAVTGTSIIAHAKSGTGKTLVYCISALNNILERKQQGLQCLILSPTREIAKQIYDVFKNVGYYIPDLKVEYFIGGTPLDLDMLKCKGCKVAIGAPGRIRHLIEMGEMKVDRVQMLVLDEVDALLCNKEFAIREMTSRLPTEKQTIVCTATFSDSIKELLHPVSPIIKYVTVNELTDCDNNDRITSNVLIGIKQFVAPVFCDSTSLDAIRKRNKLIEILRDFKYNQCFVFVNYVTIAKGLCNMLVSNNFPAMWVSSEQNQSTRISTINKLKLNQCNILVTTDLAARGIDVHNVNLVINMGIPSPADVYIHRMGRAGRYGSEGAVITVLHEGAEMEQFYKLVSAVSTDPVDLFILPNELHKNVHEAQLQTVHCEPNPNALPNVSEYQFKKNNENQIKGETKKKLKKSKKKNKSKQEEHLTEKLESNCAEKCNNSEEIVPENINVDKEMETIIEHYIKAIKEEVNRECTPIDEANLRNLFKPENNFHVVHYSNFYKPTFIAIPDKNDDEDDDVFIQTIDDTCLIRYLHSIKKRHAFIDEQKLPCSMAQFLELVEHNETLIHRLVSADMYDSINDVLEKIRRLLEENKRKQSVPMRSVNCASINFLNTASNVPKRIHQNVLINRPRTESLDTVNSIERETSNWMISRTDYLSRQYSHVHDGYRENSTLPIENFTDDPPHLHRDAPFTVYRSSRRDIEIPEQIESDDESYQQFDTQTSSRAATMFRATCQTNSNTVPNASLRSECITCPNCQHTFRLSRENNLPFLQSVKSCVNENKERRIWQHHFNFINSKVLSRSCLFENN